jgi:hypothetical protein
VADLEIDGKQLKEETLRIKARKPEEMEIRR